MADRAGKHSSTENGFSGNGEPLGYRGRKKVIAGPEKAFKKERNSRSVPR